MTALLLAFLGKFWIFIAPVLAALAWGVHQRRAGAQAARARQAASEAKARTIAEEIDDAVAGRTAEENRERLRKWSKR
jgi:hypothetical protein